MFAKIFRNRIGRKLVKALLVFSTVVTIVTTAIQMWSEYNRDLDQVEETMVQIEKSFSISLSEGIWESDKKSLLLQAEGISRLPNIERVVLRDEFGGEIVSAGSGQPERYIQKTITIFYNFGGEDQKIGEVILIANLNTLYMRLFERVGIILLVNFIKTVLVIFFMLSIVNWLITVRLFGIMNFAKNVNVTQPATPPVVSRKGIFSETDEIDNFSSEIVKMQDRLRLEHLNRTKSELHFKQLFEASDVSIWNVDFSELFLSLKNIREAGVTDLQLHLEENKGREETLLESVKITNVNAMTFSLFGTKNEIEFRRRINELTSSPNGWFGENQLFSLWGGKENYRAETTLYSTSGETIEAVVSYKNPKDFDEALSVPISVFDITEQKRIEEGFRMSEARIASILAIAPEALMTISAEGDVQSFNKGAERVFGYTEEEAIGNCIATFLPEWVFNQDEKRDFEFPPLTNKPEDDENCYGLRKNGDRFPALISVSKVEVENEDLFIAVVQDLTGRRETEKQLRTALAEAEKANQVKSEFLASVSHELRTPLNAILGFSDLIRQQYLGRIENEAYTGYANDIFSSGSHLLSLVDDLLDISLIESGNFTLQMEPFDIRKVVMECIETVSVQVAQKGISIVTKLPDNEVTLTGDERAIRQCILNILSNSVKFTDESGRIEVVLSNDVAGEVCISVKDNGIGISEERMKELSSPFHRFESDPYKPVEGWGLGLSITKSLVSQHQGSLEIDSTVDVGTTVRILLPSSPPHADER